MRGSVSRSQLKRIFLGAVVVVRKRELLCLAPALGCAMCLSGGIAPDAPFSIIIWLHPAWRWKSFFSCVLSLGSWFVSCHGWGRSGNLPCRAARCVVQPQISPGYPSMRQDMWAGTNRHSSWWSPNYLQFSLVSLGLVMFIRMCSVESSSSAYRGSEFSCFCKGSFLTPGQGTVF